MVAGAARRAGLADSSNSTELGLEVELDAAGNLIGRWEPAPARAVVVGSHLDTVPSGGRYDGALGVLSGLQAIRLLKQQGVEPKRPLWLVSFMDEEGARFGAALFGSRAFVGKDLRELGERRDADGRRACGRRWRELGFDFDARAEGARHRRASARISSCTSSRDRCSRARASRSGSSPGSSA